MHHSKKRAFIVFWSVVGTLALVAFLLWLFYFRRIAYTDDAYVQGNQVFITPLKSGFIQAIHTDDTYLVTLGQLLVELDATDSEIALNKAKENLGAVVRDVSQKFHDVFAYQSEIEVQKAEFIKAAQDFQHREDVIARAGVSLENYEHAIAALRSSFFSLWRTETLYDKALSAVQGTSVFSHPLVLAAADEVRASWVQLYRCRIYAPVEGLVAQRKIQVGMWVEAGTPLMSVIPLEQMWINANFKETQLRRMRIGQKVKITSDLYGDGVEYQGRIVGLPGAAGNAFSLLPPENLSGNWIKIVQRLPVRVALDPAELKKHPLRIGLSMEATVDLEEEGILVPVTTQGSPTYQTPIFQIEERGDKELVKRVIVENLDPTLQAYAQTPLTIEKKAASKQVDSTLETLKNYALKQLQ